MKRIAFAGALVLASTGFLLTAQTRDAGRLPACDPDNGGVGRQMAVAANGDLFVATRNSESSPGAIVALRDTNGDGKFDIREQLASEGGTGLALRRGYVYLGQDTKIVRYPRKEGELKASGPPETIVTLPDQQGHRSKGLAFDDSDGMYVNIG